MHIVDWRDEPKEVGLTLDQASFFSGSPMTARLHQPLMTVEPALHAAAFESGDYSSLVQTKPVTIAADGRLALPPLRPWGVVVFEKAR